MNPYTEEELAQAINIINYVMQKEYLDIHTPASTVQRYICDLYYDKKIRRQEREAEDSKKSFEAAQRRSAPQSLADRILGYRHGKIQ